MRQNIKESIDLYVKERCCPGGFLIAVLENNLIAAMGLADDDNRACLFEICEYIYNEIPSNCWGSQEKVSNWLNPRSD